jgi:hypothetical protein
MRFNRVGPRVHLAPATPTQNHRHHPHNYVLWNDSLQFMLQQDATVPGGCHVKLAAVGVSENFKIILSNVGMSM